MCGGCGVVDMVVLCCGEGRIDTLKNKRREKLAIEVREIRYVK